MDTRVYLEAKFAKRGLGVGNSLEAEVHQPRRRAPLPAPQLSVSDLHVRTWNHRAAVLMKFDLT